MKTLFDYINDASYCVGFTGAGVSTLSGIPDFRGKQGLYTSFDADKLFDYDYFCKNPSYFYEMSKDFIYNIDSKVPSVVHEVFALMEQAGKVKAVITQNIDMLHTRAGSKNVFEIHGSPKVHTCLSCGKTCLFDEVAPIVKSGNIPRCTSCKDVVKPDIIFFGEMLDQAVLHAAVTEASNADLIIVCGTSLVVQPAASIPVYTLENGGKLIIVNDSPTPLDSRCTACFYSLEEVFTELRSLI
ncbi:MAG TPA: Sir2 family NAD-dependent protein deacetylase [Chitinispirillaceae bacterium]|nr:Sir2 family NAD-dependent protein deacetylase [Chitinispirillaceae bacterium]